MPEKLLAVYTDETFENGIEVPLEEGTGALAISVLSVGVEEATGLKYK
jgi:hypothetical protein